MKTRRARQAEAAAALAAAGTGKAQANAARNGGNKRKRASGTKRVALGDVNPNEDRSSRQMPSGAQNKKRRKSLTRKSTRGSTRASARSSSRASASSASSSSSSQSSSSSSSSTSSSSTGASSKASKTTLVGSIGAEIFSELAVAAVPVAPAVPAPPQAEAAPPVPPSKKGRTTSSRKKTKKSTSKPKKKPTTSRGRTSSGKKKGRKRTSSGRLAASPSSPAASKSSLSRSSAAAARSSSSSKTAQWRKDKKAICACIAKYESTNLGIQPGIDAPRLAILLNDARTSIPKQRLKRGLQKLCSEGDLVCDEGGKYWRFLKDKITANSCTDIDLSFKGDPRYATGYVNDIFEFRRGLESDPELCPNHTFLDRFQQDITPNMRSILVDWLVEVAEEYKLHVESLFTAVNYVDRCLCKCQIHRHKLQLLGCACMLLAAKFEEIYAPAVEEFVYISDNTYDHEEIVTMESKVCSILNFRLTVSTSITFLGRFLMAAKVDTTGHKYSFARLPHLAHYLAELALQEYSMLLFEPSRIAAAAVALARRTLNMSPVWTPTLSYYTDYNLSSLYMCEKALRRLQRNAASGELHAIHDKYSEEKFLGVSLIPAFIGSLNPESISAMDASTTESRESRS